jgi:hypothetical protein
LLRLPYRNRSYGTPEKPSRVFQTLNKLDANGNPTSEEFHYEYDSMGRLTNAAFMQTPQTGQTGYSSTYPAAVRARVYYNYDVSGVMTNIEHYWDTWNGTKYTSVPILGAVCSYDPYKLPKGRDRPLLRGACDGERSEEEQGVC